MRKLLIASWVVVFSPGTLFPHPADDAPNPKAVIEKAIQAMGGAEKMSRFKAATFKTKGKFSGFGQPIEFDADISVQLPRQRMIVTKFDISGMRTTRIETVNGDKGWMRARGKVQDMPPDRLAQQQDELYSTWVATLLPLRDPDFTLAMAPESKVSDRPVFGVKVTHKGDPDVTLYFDKESALLVKSVLRTKGRAGKEVGVENFYSEYKDHDGVKQYTKLVVKVDGKDLAETEISDLKLLEKLEDKVFEKPPDE
jgi:hypothetical protein